MALMKQIRELSEKLKESLEKDSTLLTSPKKSSACAEPRAPVAATAPVPSEDDAKLSGEELERRRLDQELDLIRTGQIEESSDSDLDNKKAVLNFLIEKVTSHSLQVA